jgi:D-alanyl-D-alanine carboxypeptidase/D-alanyl-D-alanine-endopeptidase (penicillin-binding protein 4)
LIGEIKVKVLFFIAFAIIASVARAEVEVGPVRSEFSALAKKYGIVAKDLGIYASVGEGVDQKVLLEINPTQVMIPASITKIATASAVLENFPPGYKFKTQLLSSGEIRNDILKGSLYLKGGGDPSFVSENLWVLVNGFLRSGIRKIEGDLIVDDSLFDSVRFDESRQKERVDRAYDAPVGAMSFNWNSVNIFVRPKSKGQGVNVYIDPENEYIRLVNKAKTIGGGTNNLIADRVDDKGFLGDVIHVDGNLGDKNKEVVVYKNITQPDLWSGYNLKAFLAQRGVAVKGIIKNGIAPDSAQVLAESESKPIEQVVADMNKFSNNYVSEMLTKNLGIQSKTKAVSLADGVLVINKHLQGLGIPKEQYVIESPSGLTRNNKMSALAVWKVLRHLREDFRIQPEFLSSLPIAGVDGTLKRRMKSSVAERWVRAKTGYITNVVSLAGYAGLNDGKVITFSFIYNGSSDETKVRAFFDNVLIYLVK